MSEPAPAEQLVFRTGEHSVIPWTLLGFIFLSACVHALGFYLFQTIYPPATHMGPPPVQVGLLAPGTPEADAILRWIDSQDPTLAAEPGKAPVPGLMSLTYIPSYHTVHAQPVVPAPSIPPLRYPSGVSGLDLIRNAATRPSAANVPPAPVATVLSFSEPLRDLAAGPLLPTFENLHEAERGELQPARFLLGVSNNGDVQYVFQQDSSGEKTLDADAGRVLEHIHFKPSGVPVTWGFATFYWGSAVYARPAPAAEAAP